MIRYKLLVLFEEGRLLSWKHKQLEKQPAMYQKPLEEFLLQRFCI